MAESVLIEFIVDTTQIESAIDILERIGQVDAKTAAGFRQANAEINKQSAAIKATATSTAPLKKNLEDVDKATKKFTQDFMTGFAEGVTETLKEAGVSAEEFAQALGSGQTEVEKSSESLRQRLKVLTQAIAEMKLAGEDNTEQFKAMVVEAGNIQDAMADAGAEIRNAGSDTRSLDNLLGAAQAVAGGFAVVQGAAALFGDESEELQKTLLKVNAAMAILQGFQTLSNALQKEGALIQLFSSKQKAADAEATGLQIVAQKAYNFVVGQSVGLMRILKLALAATGVGLLVIAIIELVSQFNKFNQTSLTAEERTKNFNEALKEQEEIISQLNDSFDELAKSSLRQITNDLAYARAAKKSQTEIFALELEESRQRQLFVQERRNQQINEINDLPKLVTAYESALSKIISLEEELKSAQTEEDADRIKKEIDTQKQIADINKARVDRLKKLDNEYFDTFREAKEKELEIQKFNEEQELKSATAFAQARVLLAQVNSKEELNARISSIRTAAREQLANVNLTEGERFRIVTDVQKQINDLVFDYERRQLENAKVAIDQKLERVKEGTKSELHFRIEQAKIASEIELKEQGISAEKRLLIETQLQNKIQQLRVRFFTKQAQDVLDIEKEGNSARISEVDTSEKEKLQLRIENIEIDRVKQIAAAKGNAAEILRINSEAEQRKLEVKKSAIDAALEYELRITTARTGALKRANDLIAADEKRPLQQRIAAINQVAALEIASINKRQDALRDQLKQGLISQDDYNAQYEELKDKELEIDENAARKKKQLIKDVENARLEFATQSALQLIDIIAQFGQQQTEAEQIKIDNQRAEIEQLLEAGAITEREAKARQKRLEIEESKIKRRQAERDKSIAIFQATINTAAAVVKALATGGPVLAAVVGALGAAQIALIAARPIPRFGHGKKSGYQGLAEIGETGPELYEQNGKTYLADKRQLVWLAAKDKVYNPTETKEMLIPSVDKQVMQWQPPVEKQPDAKQIATELAKALKKMPGTNINIDEHGLKVWVQEGLSRKNYMDKRYSSK